MSETSVWSNVKFDYSGRKVLVVGGTTGIGFGVAQAYREAGAEVAITGQRGSASEYDADYGGYRYFKLDITAGHDKTTGFEVRAHAHGIRSGESLSDRPTTVVEGGSGVARDATKVHSSWIRHITSDSCFAKVT